MLPQIWDADRESARWIAPASAFAIVALGRALQIANGILHPDALFWLTAALAVAVAGTMAPRPSRLARLDAYVVPIIAVVGLIANLAQLYTKPPILVVSLTPDQQATFNTRLVVLSIAAGLALFAVPRRLRLLQMAALVGAHGAIGLWVIHQSPHPLIDVDMFQRNAVAALLHGRNPYAVSYPNIYNDSKYYGPGLSIDGRLQFGFPYFPLTLLLVMPGQILAGDYRYVHLAAMELAAVFFAYTRPKGWGPIAAALFLTTPRIFFVLEQGWTDPLVVCGLAAVVYVACRNERLLPWLFGAFLAIKQYLALALPAALLLVRQRRELPPLIVKAAIVGAVVTVPFVVWNPAAFWRSVVALQFRQPFRIDSLSYLAWWAARGHRPLSGAVGFVLATAAAGASLWRLPRTPAGFAGALALTAFVFFAFNKQAFCNYYFFVIGAWAVALAASSTPSVQRTHI